LKRFGIPFVVLAATVLAPAGSEGRLFPAGLPERQWMSFNADGFVDSVCGIIYTDASNLWSGMPLGGLGTGSITIENDGTLGYSTLFSHVWGHDAGSDGSPAWRDIVWARKEKGLVDLYVADPSRGKTGIPFLALNMDEKTWVLATRRRPGVFSTDRIEYWGHYPCVSLEYETGAPVSVGVEAWCPFVPGDRDASNIPAAVFYVKVRNPTMSPKKGSIVIGFPGASDREIAEKSCTRENIQSSTGGYHGIQVSWGGDLGYSLTTMATSETISKDQIGMIPRGTLFQPYQIPPYVKSKQDEERTVSLDAPFNVSPGEEKTIVFFLSWYSRKWDSDFPYDGIVDRSFINHYTEKFTDVRGVTDFITRNHESLHRRICKWQSVIYKEVSIPEWLRDGLINSLHLITKCGFWASCDSQGLEWSKPEGVFSLVESTVADGQQSCIPCDWYGNLPIAYFYPDLAKTTLYAYKHLSRSDGAVPFTLGRGLDLLNDQQWDRQRTLNGCCFVDLVDRLWQITGDKTVLDDFYPTAKDSVNYMLNLIPGPAGIVSTAGDQWYEAMAWPGLSSHVGGVRLATLQIIKRMAEVVGDTAFKEQCQQWIGQGTNLLEEHLWAQSHYRIFNDKLTNGDTERLQTSREGAEFIANVNEGSGTVLDLVLSHQLDGEWISDLHGVKGVFNKYRIGQTLDTISRINQPLTTAGLLVVADPSGKVANYGGRMGGLSTMPASTFITAMNYLYEGKPEEGLGIARACLHEMVCEQGMTWDMPNILIGTKEYKARVYGTDYYQCLSLWGLPAAIQGQNIKESASQGMLINRIIEAGKSE
jgi:uncharacterized protein (DUF608 family)